MNSVFSVDDFSDPFWQSPAPTSSPAMNKSASQWALEKFLEEFSTSPSSSASDNTVPAPSAVSQSPSSSRPGNIDDDVMEMQKSQIPDHSHSSKSLNHTPSAPIDSEEYRAFLKSKLDFACAVVAMSQEGSGVRPEDIHSSAEVRRLSAKNSQMGSRALGTGHGISATKNESVGAPVAIPALPAMQRKQELQVRQTTSGSSKEDSDDDELEGDTETNEHMDPSDAKRARRMQSNRESARRSRRRKQEQLGELESQVGQLRDERSSLLSRFTDINKKCDEAAVDNRILNANIETLRAKVRMAEEQVKQVTGLNPMLLPRSSMPSMGMQFSGGQADASQNVGLQMQPNLNQFFHQPLPNITSSTAPHLQRLNHSFPNDAVAPLATNLPTDARTSNVGGMTSVQLTAGGRGMVDMPSMQHAQEQASPNLGSDRALPVGDLGIASAVGKNKKKK